jgi:F0F1-type ATP synthase membrane subunit b/b'
MSERSLGELVDRLSICNIKLFYVQDMVHRAAKSAEGLDAETVAKLHQLNAERNKLATAIDQCLADAVRSGETEVDHRPKI